NAGTAGTLYGSITQPTALGSGGNNGAGGGAIKLNVSDTLTVNGSITSLGSSGQQGGAAGSIWLITTNFTGNGTIAADGSGSSRGGGGGRVAIEYTGFSYTGLVSVAGGFGSSGNGFAGTLWQPNKFPLSGSIIANTSYHYYFPNQTSAYTWNLTVNNNISVYFSNGTLNISD